MGVACQKVFTSWKYPKISGSKWEFLDESNMSKFHLFNMFNLHGELWSKWFCEVCEGNWERRLQSQHVSAPQSLVVQSSPRSEGARAVPWGSVPTSSWGIKKCRNSPVFLMIFIPDTKLSDMVMPLVMPQFFRNPTFSLDSYIYLHNSLKRKTHDELHRIAGLPSRFAVMPAVVVSKPGLCAQPGETVGTQESSFLIFFQSWNIWNPSH